jgi:CheY-like chemotaxis protein
VVRETEKLLQRTIGEQIALDVALSDDSCRVLADRGQIGQVLMNLVLNARDAMAADGGTLTIETGVYDAKRLPRAAAQRATGRRHVLLTVRDTGVGMDDDALAHIFEPFFTTKAPGEGTGLGLATVYGIVTQAGGSVWAESTVGLGSSFHVLLPEAAPRARMAADALAPASPPRPIAATVLLVEDEAAVRLSLARSLTRQGFVVRQAKNANDALMMWHESKESFDAVISDVVMPGLRGPELVARLREDRPALPVLFISGYTDFSLASADLEASNTAFLAKPFTIEDLSARLRSLLENVTTMPVREGYRTGGTVPGRFVPGAV